MNACACVWGRGGGAGDEPVLLFSSGLVWCEHWTPPHCRSHTSCLVRDKFTAFVMPSFSSPPFVVVRLRCPWRHWRRRRWCGWAASVPCCRRLGRAPGGRQIRTAPGLVSALLALGRDVYVPKVDGAHPESMRMLRLPGGIAGNNTTAQQVRQSCAVRRWAVAFCFAQAACAHVAVRLSLITPKDGAAAVCSAGLICFLPFSVDDGTNWRWCGGDGRDRKPNQAPKR